MDTDLRELVHFLASELVENPDEVEVQVRDGATTLYELRVHPDDHGRLIGREGRTIKALRSLVSAAARKSGVRATVDLAE